MSEQFDPEFVDLISGKSETELIGLREPLSLWTQQLGEILTQPPGDQVTLAE